jgi:ABC-2 type transport system ATP-binding protein
VDSPPLSTPPPAIRLENVRKLYGDKAAVDGLTLTVPQGCFFGFLGPNGAGKTTTIKMLMGLAPPTSGHIELLGLPMPERALEIKRLIGLVPDESLLFDHLTGGEFIEFVGRIYGLDRTTARERSAELLQLFELDNAPRKLIAEYSKGMRKRVAMAAALIHRPKLFLMDEPFEGVDAVGARLMKEILQEQVRTGATIFLTSHVLEVVERLCDRVAIIHSGKIVTEGRMDDLRGSAETLEDAFVRAVGFDRPTSSLDWLATQTAPLEAAAPVQAPPPLRSATPIAPAEPETEPAQPVNRFGDD